MNKLMEYVRANPRLAAAVVLVVVVAVIQFATTIWAIINLAGGLK